MAHPGQSIRALELFAGIGGFAAAVRGTAVHVAGAFDQDEAACATYRQNFPGHCLLQRDLGKISAWELSAYDARLWWLSPPCQPYCERGARRDLDDHRARSLVHLMGILERLPADLLPGLLALENVEGFTESAARDRLLELLTKRGYHLLERLLCPTELGIPSRRPRYYLAASLNAAPTVTGQPARRSELIEYLIPEYSAAPPEYLLVDEVTLARYGAGLRILDPLELDNYTTCFTSGYGRSVMAAGAYLACASGVRRFAPEEIARLLHFPADFTFPPQLTPRRKWGLVGNSLSVAAVREVLRSLGVLP